MSKKKYKIKSFKKNNSGQKNNNAQGQQLMQGLMYNAYNLVNNNVGNNLTNGQFLNNYTRKFLITHNYNLLTTLTQTNGIIQRIVSAVVEESFKSNALSVDISSIEGDELNEFNNLIQSTDCIHKLKEALIISKVYGGSAIIMFLKGEEKQDLSKPLTESLLQETDKELCFGTTDKWRLNGIDTNVYHSEAKLTDLFSNNKQAEFYNYEGYSVHKTRVMLISNPSKVVLPFYRSQLQGYGVSDLESIIDPLSKFFKYSGTQYEATDRMLQTIYKIDGLNEALGNVGGKQGQNIKKRVSELLEDGLTTKSIAAIDSGDDVQTTTLNLAGIEGIEQSTRSQLAASIPMPENILFQQTASGLNASGEDTLEMWAMQIENFRENIKEYVVDIVAVLYNNHFGVNVERRDIFLKWKNPRVEKKVIEEARKTNLRENIKMLAELGVLKNTQQIIDIVNKGDLLPIALEDEDREIISEGIVENY